MLTESITKFTLSEKEIRLAVRKELLHQDVKGNIEEDEIEFLYKGEKIEFNKLEVIFTTQVPQI